MSSNLSTIGFAFADEESFQESMIACARSAGTGLACAAGAYRIWRSRAGAELWFHTGPASDGETEILGLSPFFEGHSEVLLNITKAIKRPGDNVFEGAFYGWVSPDDKGQGSYPMVFDAVDFAARQDTVWPTIKRVRLSGFARELKCFASDEAYLSDSEVRPEPRFSATAFIPIGLFAAAEADRASHGKNQPAPSSNALVTGRIAEHRLFTNEVSNCDFHWFLIESLEATFDVIADPQIVKGDIVPGGTIETTCTMFGRFLD